MQDRQKLRRGDGLRTATAVIALVAVGVIALRWQFITVQTVSQLSLFKEVAMFTAHLAGPVCKLAISAVPLFEHLFFVG